MAVIAVGIDGTARSAAALAWAIEEAALRQATLRIVHAWQPAMLAAGVGAGWAVPSGPTLDASVSDARRAAQSVIDDAKAQAAEAGVESEALLVEGGAVGEVLADAARGADLLVVGTHGRGLLAELLLGSVSHHCTGHAPCPVVTVRQPPAPGEQKELAPPGQRRARSRCCCAASSPISLTLRPAPPPRAGVGAVGRRAVDEDREGTADGEPADARQQAAPRVRPLVDDVDQELVDGERTDEADQHAQRERQPEAAAEHRRAVIADALRRAGIGRAPLLSSRVAMPWRMTAQRDRKPIGATARRAGRASTRPAPCRCASAAGARRGGCGRCWRARS